MAIVGCSGCGKSTLIKLLLGHYRPDQGHLFVAGEAAVVPQEPSLFDASVAVNIGYGNHADREAIEAAAQAADASEFITALPKGFDTRVGAKGVQLSGGQRQRLCVARALARGAPILVLDEPTAALDWSSAQIVCDTLASIIRRPEDGRAVVLVSHQLSLMKFVTTVAIMEGGRIVERAPHQQLLQESSRYRQLFGLE